MVWSFFMLEEVQMSLCCLWNQRNEMRGWILREEIKHWNGLRSYIIIRQVEGLARRAGKELLPLVENERLVRKGKKVQAMKKLLLPVFFSKQFLSSYTERELEGEKRESPRNKPMLSKTSLGLIYKLIYKLSYLLSAHDLRNTQVFFKMHSSPFRRRYFKWGISNFL